jgi:DNA invertase Pin-like site-specific DNA recombinase
MKKTDPNTDELIPACLYLRMSSDDQEGSIEQQRAELHSWAQGKYKIVREYVDSGKSGSKNQERRVEFRRMILDSGKGEWQAILCWKTNRFGRLDSQEGALDKKTLRQNGIYLDTVKDGRIDWETLEGRIIDAVRSEMDHAFSRGVSSDSLRGRLKVLADGHWPNGSVPYGFHRLYRGPDGREIRVLRSEGFRKPKGWLLHLVVCEEEKAIVQWLFEQFTHWDRSLRQIAMDLNRRGVPSPSSLGKSKGQGWTVYAVKWILTDPAYLGIGYIGSGRGHKRGAFGRAEDMRQAGVCPVLVEAALWEQAQRLLAGRKITRRKPRQNSGALAGILYCAHCRYRLHQTHYLGRISYYCKSSSLRPGEVTCSCWQVYEDEILPLICAKLVQTVDGELVKALAAQPPVAEQLSDLDMLRGHMAELEKKIDQANQRYLTAPAELLPGLERSLLAMKAEMSECEDKLCQLASASGESAIVNFARWWEGVRGQLLLVPTRPPENEGVFKAAQLFWSRTRDTQQPRAAAEYELATGEKPEWREDKASVLVEPAALRSLLVRLGVRVECSFNANKKRAVLQGKGSQRAWLLKRAVLRIQGGNGPADEGAYTLTLT